MQEVFEKIIERLKKECFLTDMTYDDDGYFDGGLEQAVYLEKAIEIVEQVEEEYVSDINVGNNGWIPCSERLPERYCHCLVTRRNKYEDGFDTDVREDTYVEIEGIWDWQSKHEGLMDEIIAWKPLPEAYQPNGE